MLLISAPEQELGSPSTFRGKSDDDDEEEKDEEMNLLSLDKYCDDGCDKIGVEVDAAAADVEDNVVTAFDVYVAEDEEDIDMNEEVGCRGTDDDADEDDDDNNEDDVEMCNALSDNVDIVL